MSSGAVALVVVLVVALGATTTAVVVLARRLSLTRRRLQDTTVARDTLLARDRDIAINASHRLRTPITALRLSLEDLTHWPETTPVVAEELQRSLAEIDRWGEAVGQMLGQAHGHRLGSASDVDLTSLTAKFVRANASRVRPRDLTHRSSGPVPARVDDATFDEVLTLLLDHLLAHGSGPIRMDVAAHANHLQVRLADTSPRTLPPGVLRHGGPCKDELALAEAGVLAESLGGYVAVEDRSATRFVLLLPLPPADEGEADTLG